MSPYSVDGSNSVPSCHSLKLVTSRKGWPAPTNGDAIRQLVGADEAFGRLPLRLGLQRKQRQDEDQWDNRDAHSYLIRVAGVVSDHFA
jgi:hypothetical protein